MSWPGVAEALAEIAARADAGALLFALPGWRREKLQVLRWLGRDAAGSGERMAALLARALADPDWEVRASAMICAGRVGARSLRPMIARLALPDTSASGAARRERGALLALRDAVLAQLGAPRDRALPEGVVEALAGDYGRLPGDLAPFVHALAEPLPDQFAETQARGVVWASTGPRLTNGRLLAWVAPVTHWLGDATLRRAEPNPPRQVLPAQGFFIDAERRGPAVYADAQAAAQAEARRLDRPVSLPPPDLWEMAARGPDGRRFTWGANAEPSARVDLSPWGVAGIASGPGEWLAGIDPTGSPLAAGGSDSPAMAARKRTSAFNLLCFRFIYPVI